MSIQYTERQLDIIRKTVKWFYTQTHIKQVWTIVGSGGSGKSSILKKIIESIGLPANKTILYSTISNKAALVLRIKGSDASTVAHNFYQVFVNKKTGGVLFRKKTRLESKTALIVIDEASMVGDRIMRDIESFGVPIILMGDRKQLGPIGDRPNRYIFNPCNYDAELTEIFRQHKDSKIIDMSYKAYEGEYLPYCNYDDFVVTRYGHIRDNINLYDMVLCFRNNTRKMINRQVRKICKYESIYPTTGERVLIMKNNYNHIIKYTDIDIFTLNGLISCMDNNSFEFINKRNQTTGLLVKCIPDFIYDNEPNYKDFTFTIPVYKEPFQHYIDRSITLPIFYTEDERERYSNHVVMDFAYGCSIHKSQGSQWKNVLIVDDFEKGVSAKMRNSLMYTAISRAVEKCTIARNLTRL